MTTRRSHNRRWLGAALVVVAAMLAGGERASRAVAVAPAAAAAPSAPNIIMVLTDDQDVQLGSVNYMPNVKKLLAQQGVSFSNFYVPLSLCCPSRTTILRGQYPHNTQVLTNGLPNGGFEKVFADNLESSTMATLLKGAGYRTVMLGKYLNGYPNTAPSPSYIPPGWDEWYSPSAGNPYSEYNYTLNENGTQVVYHSSPSDYLTDVIRGKAVDFIQRAAPSQPVFVYFATYAPHAPYTPAPRHMNLFSNLKAPRPPSFNEPDVSGKPAYIMTKPRLTQTQIDSIDADYRNRLRALQAVDEAVAALVATLSATGRLANTYIFFTADNGYHMGEHRLLPGKYTPYETDIHVPLIVRGPGVLQGIVRDQFGANLDLAETFADLAGVAQLPFSDGRSLKGLLGATPPSAWRRAFLLEEFNQGEIAPVDSSGDPASKIGILEPPDPADIAAAAQAVQIPTYYGFQAPGYKYVEYLNLSGQIAETELYLSSDPYELHNLASQLDPTLAESLDAYTQTLVNCVGDACRAAEAVAPPSLSGAFPPSDTTLLVDDQAGDHRFAVQVSYQTSQSGGLKGNGHAIPLSPVGIARGGAFWFFSPDNPEMLVKLLDACDANSQKWFFASAGTNVGFTATVTDTLTLNQKTYTNQDLTAAVPIQDTSFESCASTLSGPTSGRPISQGGLPPQARSQSVKASRAEAASGPCTPGPTTLCVDGVPGDQRFKVEVSYHTSQGGGLSGHGQAIPLAPVGIIHGGAFWFFSSDNPEMLVKVIDGCGANAKKWVFASAGTNVGLTVTVTDTTTGAQKIYQNADLHAAQPIQDTSAFATCP
ncbi:MAG TPA: sulfatase [Thermoanaerobaculia bacterium]|nr:sulfatase [Thermoanaerobaculia bacterium]